MAACARRVLTGSGWRWAVVAMDGRIATCWIGLIAMAESWIISDPAVLGGKPCIRGTRISVEHVLELLASRHDRPLDFPLLADENIRPDVVTP